MTSQTYEVDIRLREDVFGLHQLPGMTLMEEVIDAVSVDTNASGSKTFFRHLGRDLKRYFIDDVTSH